MLDVYTRSVMIVQARMKKAVAEYAQASQKSVDDDDDPV
jgi:hypothetical protein